MRFIPLYGTTYRRPGRGPFFQKWARITFGIVVGVIALNYGIKGFFDMMPLAEATLRAHGLLP